MFDSTKVSETFDLFAYKFQMLNKHFPKHIPFSLYFTNSNAVEFQG